MKTEKQDGIRALFLEDADLEANTLFKAEGTIYLQAWVDCEEFITAPAWRTTLAPHNMPMHDLTLINAYDLSSGENVNCPIPLPEFQKTIEWEDFANRREAHRPDKEWAGEEASR